METIDQEDFPPVQDEGDAGGEVAVADLPESQSPLAPSPVLPPLRGMERNYGVQSQALPSPYQRSSSEAARAAQIEFIRDVYNKLPAGEAAKAVEMATQLEGRLGYDADVQAGASPHEALV